MCVRYIICLDSGGSTPRTRKLHTEIPQITRRFEHSLGVNLANKQKENSEIHGSKLTKERHLMQDQSNQKKA